MLKAPTNNQPPNTVSTSEDGAQGVMVNTAGGVRPALNKSCFSKDTGEQTLFHRHQWKEPWWTFPQDKKFSAHGIGTLTLRREKNTFACRSVEVRALGSRRPVCRAVGAELGSGGGQSAPLPSGLAPSLRAVSPAVAARLVLVVTPFFLPWAQRWNLNTHPTASQTSGRDWTSNRTSLQPHHTICTKTPKQTNKQKTRDGGRKSLSPFLQGSAPAQCALQATDVTCGP